MTSRHLTWSPSPCEGQRLVSEAAPGEQTSSQHRHRHLNNIRLTSVSDSARQHVSRQQLPPWTNANRSKETTDTIYCKRSMLRSRFRSLKTHCTTLRWPSFLFSAGWSLSSFTRGHTTSLDFRYQTPGFHLGLLCVCQYSTLIFYHPPFAVLAQTSNHFSLLPWRKDQSSPTSSKYSNIAFSRHSRLVVG